MIKSLKLISIILLFTINSNIYCQPQVAKPPYPIVFMHGWDGSDSSWQHENPDLPFSGNWKLYQENLGWTYGGRINACLESETSSLHDEAIDDIYIPNDQFTAGDFYFVNFDFKRDHSDYLSTYFVINPILSLQDPITIFLNPLLNNGDPEEICEDDILVLEHGQPGEPLFYREYLKVLSAEPLNGEYLVSRGEFGSLKSLWLSNLKMKNHSNLSSQSSAVKQGIALGQIINNICSINSCEKVIIVCHSMGGLAAREYVQRHYNNNVAKVVTIGSPHLGSDMSDIDIPLVDLFQDLDLSSDAVRDLRVSRVSDLILVGPNPPYPSNPDNATYLFGGTEDQNWTFINFYSKDFDGDGIESTDYIEGLNNYNSQWPTDVGLHTIIGRRNINSGDNIVRADRQYPWDNIFPDNFIYSSGINLDTSWLLREFFEYPFHTKLQDYIEKCMRGLDEPDYFNQAYQLSPNTTPNTTPNTPYTNGFTTYQSSLGTYDIDFFKFESDKNGQATIKLIDQSDPLDWNLRIYDENGIFLGYEIDESNNTNQLPFEVEVGQTYVISFESKASPGMYNSPYGIKVETDYNPEPIDLLVTSSNYAVNITTPVTITTIVSDQNNNNLEGQLITFTTNESGTFSSGNQATTNSAGVASIVYTPIVSGTHIVTATASNNESGSLSQSIIVSDPNFGHDLELTRLLLDEEWLTPGQNLDFSFDVRNPGIFTENTYTIQYQLKDQDGTVLETDSESGIVINPEEILPVFNSTLSISSGYADGFYDIYVEVVLPGDCAQGNNVTNRSVYIGTENPFRTYLMESSDVLLNKNQNYNLGGYNVKFTSHDGNHARVIVDGEQRDIAYNEFSFFDAFQFNLIYKGYFSSSEAAFRYAQPSSLVSFSPQKLVIEAGKTGTFSAISNENDDPTPSIDVTLEGGLDGSIVQNWNSSAYTFGTPYSNVYYDIEVPSDATLGEYNFWVKMVADGQFYQRLKIEVIDPIPDFTYNYDKSLLRLAPGMTDSIRLILNPQDGFNEAVLLNTFDLPPNVSCIITNNNLLLIDTTYLKIHVDPSFNSFNYYSSSVSMVSASRNKSIAFDLDIVDDTQNDIEITSVEYFDTDYLYDSLKVNFNSQFIYSSNAQTMNWQYTLDSETWVDIPASEITNNTSYSQGSHYINWEIPTSPALFSTSAKFRMNQKSGPDFLFKEYEEDYSGEDFMAIMYWNNILYVLDENASKVYKYQYSNHTFTYLNKFSISVPNGKGEEFVYCYNKIYLVDKSDEDVWVFNSNWGYITKYNISVDWGAMIKMDNHLYFHDDELNLFVEVDQYLNQTGTYYNCPYPYYTNYGFFDEKNIWLGRGNDLYKVSNDFQSYEHFVLSRGMDAMCIVGDELIATSGSDDLYVFNFNYPYSFYSASSSFNLNNTYQPFIANIPDFITIENSALVGEFNLLEKISDPDTPTENLTISLLSGPGADVQFNTMNDSLIDITPDTEWFGYNHFEISVSDGFSNVEKTVNVFVLEENHVPSDFSLVSPLSGGTTLSITPTFSWNSSSDPDPDDFVYYTLMVGTDPSFSVGTYNNYNYIFDTAYTINNNLLGETVYYWKVKANDNEGGVKWSSQIDWWFETPIAILENRIIENITLTNGQSECYNATNTITVAGSGTTVDINSGGTANFIAGGTVLFKPGFHSHSGSTTHAYITTTSDYCSSLPPLIATPDIIAGEQLIDAELYIVDESNIKIYPNPTTGNFIIDFMGKISTAEIILLNFQGKQIIEQQCKEQLKKDIDISHLPGGMYIVVIKTEDKIITRKIIKNY